MKKFFRESGCRLLPGVIGVCLFAGSSVDAKWSFGVMSDNHLTNDMSVINQIDAKFIEQGVKFVIQAGDLVNANVSPAAGAATAQQLYDAGIGFFPVRGNHEAWPSGAIETFKISFPQTRGLENTFGAVNFSSPGEVSEELVGLSYSFDYFMDGENARFVFIDNWGTPTVYSTPIATTSPYGHSVFSQQEWISGRLDKATRGTEHAFVISHHNLIGENHYDCLFGWANENPEGQDLFFSALGFNNVKFYISGHEHLYNRSVITSPDGNNHVMDIICGPGSSKKILPKNPADPKFFEQKSRQLQVAQEYDIVGYYIYTIDGPRVTADYYSATNGAVLNFSKKETFGYSLNGKEFFIAQGASYNGIADNFEGTTARILNGTNDCSSTDLEGRALTKSVTTGWSGGEVDHQFRSKVLTLWGLADFGTDETDVFALEMSYVQGKTRAIDKGCFGIGTIDAEGNWVNAVNANLGGTKLYVKGPWRADYGLGTYGVDPSTKTAWAVVNHAGDFVVKNDIEARPED